MSDRQRTFVPFNLTTVIPFDAFSVALKELPTPQLAEPKGEFSHFAHGSLPSGPPSRAVQSEMLQAMGKTAREGSWGNFNPQELKPRRTGNTSEDAWVFPLCGQLAATLRHTEKRPNSSNSSPKRHTPKRPRTSTVLPSSAENVRTPSISSAPTCSKEPLQSITPSQTPKGRKDIIAGSLSAARPHVKMEQKRPTVHQEYTHQREIEMRKTEKVVEMHQYQEFINYLERFGKRHESFAKYSSNVNEAMLLVTKNEASITELRQRILVFGRKGAFAHVDADLLGKVISILLQRICDASKVCAAVSNYDIGSSHIVNAKLGLLCCSTILAILSSPSCPRKLLVEELFDEIFSLIRSCATLIIFPLCDPLYKASKLSRAKKFRRAPHHRINAINEDHDYSNEDEAKMLNKRASNPRRQLSKRDKALIDAFCTTLDAMSAVFSKERYLPDSTTSRISSLCIQSLSVTGIFRIHSHAMKTACIIFRSYPLLRISMLDELREVISVIPAARRHLRCYQLQEDEGSVRASTALLAQLICIICQDGQCDTTKKGTSSNEGGGIQSPVSSLRRKNHERAVKLALHVLDPLLKKVQSDREIEYRTAFQSFFEDLLFLFGRPEWPSAELLLQTLSVSIITKLRAREKSTHSRGIAIDVLGALAARMCVLYGEDILKTSERKNSFVPKQERVKQERAKVLLYLNPDRSLHFAAASAFFDAVFVVEDYSNALNMEDHAKRTVEERNREGLREDEELMDGEEDSLTGKYLLSVEEHVVRRSKEISERRLRNEDVQRSAAVGAAVFLGKRRSFTTGFGTIIEAIFDGMHDPAPTIRAKSIKALSAVDESCNGLIRVMPSVLKYIETSCRDVSTLARDAALDLLSRSLLSSYNVDALDASQNKESKAATLDNDQKAELTFRIFSIVEKRLCDTATSVRKRAISIMRAVLSNALSTSEKLRGKPMDAIGALREIQKEETKIIQICASLVSRLDDPETTVREAAERALRYGMFGFDISQQLYRVDGEEGERASLLANRFITVFGRLPSSIHGSFVSRIVHKAMLIKCKPLLEEIVSATVEQMREYESNMASIISGKNHNSLVEAQLKRLRMLSIKRVACSSVVCALGQLDASLIVPHCRALAPSIKGLQELGSSENDLICIQRILQVLEIGFRNSESHEKSFLEEVLRDVELIVCTSPIYLLEEASVKCLCVISEKLDETEFDPVKQAAENFLGFLSDQIGALQDYCLSDMPEKPSALERNARGALVRLGLLVRYGCFDHDFVTRVYETFESISETLSMEGHRDVLARACIRAMSHLVICHRSFLTRGTAVFVEMLRKVQCSGAWRSQSHVAEGIHLAVLQSIHELLRDEEERNSGSMPSEVGGLARQPKASLHTQLGKSGTSSLVIQSTKENSSDLSNKPMLAAEEDTEAGFLALSAQAMIPSIKRAASNPSASVRRTAANILGLLVRQGLLLPGIVVGELFGLLLDRDTRCREFSFRVVAFLADRYANMLASAAILALRVCFWNSYKVHAPPQISRSQDDSSVDEALETYSVPELAQMYTVVIDSKNGESLLSQALMIMRRDQRRGVLESMLREFDPRAVLRAESAENSSETRVQVPEVEYVPRYHVSNVEESGGEKLVSADPMDILTPVDTDAKLNVVEKKVSNDTMANTSKPEQSDDDDDLTGVHSNSVLDLSCADPTCSIPTLFFLALTIACTDYTNGAGIGGSLTQGGGTMAAETKLKYGKEEVSHMISIATRVISNSGQSILRVARQLLKRKNGELEKRARVATLAARMSVLLQLKHHLKVVRWKALASNEEAKENAESGGVIIKMAAFEVDGMALRFAGWNATDVLSVDEDSANEILARFCNLMKHDAIDEAEMVTSMGRRGGRNARRSSIAGGTLGNRRRFSQGAAARPRRRTKLLRRVSVSKRVDMESDDDEGSDFDPSRHG